MQVKHPISNVVLVQEYRLSEVGFKIGMCHLNDQDEEYKFVHLFPERLTTSELL